MLPTCATRWIVPGMAVLVLALPPIASAQDHSPTASRSTGTGTHGTGTRETPELKIVFWYDRRRPLESFHFQVYDVRRHEFSQAVDRWLADVRGNHPGYEAYVRDVFLRRVRGDTEAHKIGAAVLDEFLVLGARSGYEFGPAPPARSRIAGPLQPPALRPFPVPSWPSPLSTTPSIPFPTPLPYPRPHP